MKRLLRISFDLSLLSFIPIILWFLLGIIVDKNLINIFSLSWSNFSESFNVTHIFWLNNTFIFIQEYG